MSEVVESEEEDFLHVVGKSDSEDFLDHEPEAPVPPASESRLVVAPAPPMTLAVFVAAAGETCRKGPYWKVLTKKQLAAVTDGTADYSEVTSGSWGTLSKMMFSREKSHYMSNRVITKTLSLKSSAHTNRSRWALANVAQPRSNV